MTECQQRAGILNMLITDWSQKPKRSV